VVTSPAALVKRLGQLDRNEAGFDPAKLLPAGTDAAQIKSFMAVDARALLNYGAQFALPFLMGRMEDDKELHKALNDVAKQRDPFKDLPPLVAFNLAPKDGVHVTEIHGPAPYLPTAFGIGIVIGFISVQEGAHGQ